MFLRNPDLKDVLVTGSAPAPCSARCRSVLLGAKEAGSKNHNLNRCGAEGGLQLVWVLRYGRQCSILGHHALLLFAPQGFPLALRAVSRTEKVEVDKVDGTEDHAVALDRQPIHEVPR